MSSITVNKRLSPSTHLKVRGARGVMIFLCFLSFFPFANSAHAGLILQHPTYTGLNSGLVGYWSFDGKDMANITAYDRSGQNNNGTLTGGPTRAKGKLGQALSFDGTDDYVLTSNLGPTGNPAVSVSEWVKTTSTSEIDFFSYGSDAAIGVPEYFRLGLNINATDYIGTRTGNGVRTFVATGIRDGNWHHIVVSKAANDTLTNLKVYMDGVLLTTTGDDNNPTGVWNIGGGSPQIPISIGHNPNGGGAWSGSIDEVRIYNRALTPDEIKRLYKIGATLKINTSINNDSLQKGLVGYWSFDGKDMAGLTAYDRSGSNPAKNGTLTGTNGPPVRIAGKLGQGLSFDGVDDRVNAGNAFTTTTNLTHSLWVKLLNTPSQLLTIMQNGDVNIALNGYGIAISNGACGAGTEINVYLSGVSCDAVSSTTNLPINEWHLITLTRDTTTWRLYLDGQLKHTGTQNPNTPDGVLYWGRVGGVGYSIDDVRIYNRALSPDEIKRLYRIGGTLHVNTSINNDSLQKGLVGYWSFDGKDVAGIPSTALSPGTVYDRSGQGNNGKYYNATGTQPVAGKIGQALNFNGIDSFAALGTGASLDIDNNITLSAWIKTADNISHYVLANRTGEQGYALLIYNGIASLQTGATNWSGLPGTSNVQDGRWHHLLGTYDTNIGGKIYVDGVLEGSSSVTGQLTTAAGIQTYIGNGLGVANPFFNGSIDDVRVYNRALTGDEIKRLYNLGR